MRYGANSLSLVELVLNARLCFGLHSPRHGGVGVLFPTRETMVT